MDRFGNLTEWGRVLEEIDVLRANRELDRQQEGLLRILRYRDNWRLREAVLEATKDMDAPGEALLSAVLDIMMDESLYQEVRVLAAEALATSLARANEQKRHDLDHLKQHAVEQIAKLLDSTLPPVIHQAVRRVPLGIE